MIRFEPAARFPPSVAPVIVCPDRVPPVTVPETVAPLIVGDVSVLFVSV